LERRPRALLTHQAKLRPIALLAHQVELRPGALLAHQLELRPVALLAHHLELRPRALLAHQVKLRPIQCFTELRLRIAFPQGLGTLADLGPKAEGMGGTLAKTQPQGLGTLALTRKRPQERKALYTRQIGP